MKKMFLLLLCSVLVVSSMSVAFADSDIDINLEESHDVFYRFLSNANIEDINAIYHSGEIAETQINNSIRDNLLSKNYDRVFELLERYNLSLSYVREEKNNLSRSIGSEVSRTKTIYHLEYDDSKKFRKEWTTDLFVQYRENEDGTLTALGNPRAKIDADFGGAFDVDISGISTGYMHKNKNKEIEFYCTYNLKAKLIYPIVIGGMEFPIGKQFHWGEIYAGYTQK